METVRSRGPVALVAAAGGAGLVTGALLPWMSFYGGLETVRGTAGTNGRVLLGAGVIAVLVGAWFLLRGGSAARWGLGLVGLAASGLSAWLVAQLLAAYRATAHEPLVFARLGPGLFVAAAGAVLVLATLLIGATRPAPATAEEAIPLPAAAGSRPSWRWMPWLALFSAGAALVHLTVIGEHTREWWAAGVFFVAVGVGQMAWALVAVLRPGRRLLWIGLAGNAAIIAIWVVSRTVGLPFGPQALRPEHVGVADVLATDYEALLAVGCAWLLRRPAAEPEDAASQRDSGIRRAARFALAAAVIAGTVVAMLSAVGL